MLVKNDHNQVYDFGDYFKKTYTKKKLALIEKEIYNLQGIPAENPEDGVLIVPNLGKNIENFYLWTEKAPEVLKAINLLRPKVRYSGNWEKQLRKRIQSRIEKSEIPESLKTTILTKDFVFPKNLEFFIHGDPQLSNWVESGSNFQLIDWESSGYGPKEFDLAAIRISLVKEGKDHLWVPFIEQYGNYDKDLFLQSLSTKYISALSWSALHRGEEGLQSMLSIEEEIFNA